MDSVADCVFCRIVAGEIPSESLYQDEEIVAIRDIQPAAPLHALVLPRRHVATVNDLGEEDLHSMLGVPLRVRGQPIGTLTVQNYQPRFKSPLYPWVQIAGVAVGLLSLFLIGLCVGALLLPVWTRRGVRPAVAAGWIQIAMGAYVAASLYWLPGVLAPAEGA